YFQNSGDTRHLWQGIQAITNRTASPACDRDASLPDVLNNFYVRFEVQNRVTARKTIPPHNNQVLGLTTADNHEVLPEACHEAHQDPPCRYHPNHSTDDAITTTLYLALKTPGQKDHIFTNCVYGLQYSIQHHQLSALSILGLNSSLCNWILYSLE
ncbi:hypothetical protein QTP86_020675, partial [Hemibagrus guttatus]